MDKARVTRGARRFGFGRSRLSALGLWACGIAFRARPDVLVVEVLAEGARLRLGHRYKLYASPIWIAWSELDRIVWEEGADRSGGVRFFRKGELRGVSMLPRGIDPRPRAIIGETVAAAETAGYRVDRRFLWW